jgi:hypothetical protein
MFDNIQYEDEYACQAIVNRHTDTLLLDDVKQHVDKITDAMMEQHDQWTYCTILHGTVFCERCAKKLKFRCPTCGGTIALERTK